MDDINTNFVSNLNIDGQSFVVLDTQTAELVASIVESIQNNNTAIGNRINNLNTRLEVIEGIEHDKDKTPLVVVNNIGSTITIDPYKMYDLGNINKKVTIIFNTSLEESNFCAQYAIKFVVKDGCEIELPSNVLYENGNLPMFVVDRTYEFHVNNNIVSVGEFYNVNSSTISQVEQNIQLLINARLLNRVSNLENEINDLTWELNDLRTQLNNITSNTTPISTVPNDPETIPSNTSVITVTNTSGTTATNTSGITATNTSGITVINTVSPPYNDNIIQIGTYKQNGSDVSYYYILMADNFDTINYYDDSYNGIYVRLNELYIKQDYNGWPTEPSIIYLKYFKIFNYSSSYICEPCQYISTETDGQWEGYLKYSRQYEFHSGTPSGVILSDN